MVTVNVATKPGGLSFSVDSVTYTSAQTFNWVVGSNHTIATTSPQSGGPGVQAVWKKWSDNGGISHVVVAPSAHKNYLATFQIQYFLTMNAGAGGTVTPASGWQNAGKMVKIKATANPGHTFVNWTGSGPGSFTGTTNPAQVTMMGPITESASFSP